jgi:hypothetical protein
MEVPNEFKEIGLLVHHDRFVPVLEEMPAPLVSPIEGARISGEKRTHGAGQWTLGSPHKQVRMVWQECPGIYVPSAGFCRRSKTLDKIVSVLVIRYSPSPKKLSRLWA